MSGALSLTVSARALGLLALAALAAAAAPSPAHAQADSRPNVLFIVTDDQRLDGTIINGATEVMPKTWDWFKEGGQLSPGGETFSGGTFYPNAVATTPLCCPSRSTIFTGKYPHNHGIRMNGGGGDTFEETWADRSLQAYLQAAGYRTGIFGRYLPGWTRFGTANLLTPPRYWNDWSFASPSDLSGQQVNENGVHRWVWRYGTDYLADKAEDFLDAAANSPSDPPFFLYVAPHSPHGPHRPAPAYTNTGVPAVDETDPFFEQNRRDKPMYVRTGRWDSDWTKTGWKAYLRQLLSVDHLVDRVMRKLRALGEDENTIAFFTSDNGYQWGQHGLAHKEKPYLESTEVPFFLRWPGHVLSNREDTGRLTGNVDMAPTVIDAINDAAGPDIAPTISMDGVSLVEPFQVLRQRMLTEHCGWGSSRTAARHFQPGTPPSWASIHTGRIHYIEHYRTGGWPDDTPEIDYPDDPTGCPGGYQPTDFTFITDREFYDLQEDPKEKTNLLGDDDPENDPPTAALQAELEEDRQCREPAAQPTQPSNCVPTPVHPLDIPVEVKITRAPQDPTGSTSATFKFTSNQPNVQFQCRQAKRTELESQRFTPCTSPKTYTGLVAGEEYGFEVVQVGLNYDSKTHFWDVVAQRPETTITGQPDKVENTTDATFTFSSTELGSGFRCKRDDQPEEICDSGTISYSGLVQGPHTFRVYAVGGSASDQSSPAQYEWSIDSIAPDTRPIQPLNFSANRAGVTFPVTCQPAAGGPCSDNSDARDVLFQCRLRENGSTPAFTACGIPDGNVRAKKTYSGLVSGKTYTFEARSVDLAGNIGPAQSYQWTISALKLFAEGPTTDWPEITSGTQVNAIVPDGQGGWFVGGDFTQVGSDANPVDRTDLVHITAQKTVDPNWNPATDSGSVKALALRNGVLYVGGSFTNIDNASPPRHRIAAINATTGELISGWAPDVQDGEVRSIAIGPPVITGASVTSLYVGGSFKNINSSIPLTNNHKRVAELIISNGAPTSWDPNVVPGIINAVAVTESHVYVGGENILSIGGDTRSPTLRQIERATAQVTGWVPNPRTDTGGVAFINSLELRRAGGTLLPPAGSLTPAEPGGIDTMYVGGNFVTIGVPPNPSDPQPTRHRAAEVNLSDGGPRDAETGTVTGWDPSLNASGAVRDFLTTDCSDQANPPQDNPVCSTLIAGNVTATGSSHARLIETERNSGAARDWSTAPSNAPFALASACPPLTAPPNPITYPSACDTHASRVLAVGGLFTTIGGQTRDRLAFFDAP